MLHSWGSEVEFEKYVIKNIKKWLPMKYSFSQVKIYNSKKRDIIGIIEHENREIMMSIEILMEESTVNSHVKSLLEEREMINSGYYEVVICTPFILSDYKKKELRKDFNLKNLGINFLEIGHSFLSINYDWIFREKKYQDSMNFNEIINIDSNIDNLIYIKKTLSGIGYKNISHYFSGKTNKAISVGLGCSYLSLRITETEIKFYIGRGGRKNVSLIENVKENLLSKSSLWQNKDNEIKIKYKNIEGFKKNKTEIMKSVENLYNILDNNGIKNEKL